MKSQSTLTLIEWSSSKCRSKGIHLKNWFLHGSEWRRPWIWPERLVWLGFHQEPVWSPLQSDVDWPWFCCFDWTWIGQSVADIGDTGAQGGGFHFHHLVGVMIVSVLFPCYLPLVLLRVNPEDKSIEWNKSLVALFRKCSMLTFVEIRYETTIPSVTCRHVEFHY